MTEINPVFGLGSSQRSSKTSSTKSAQTNESLFTKLDKNKDGKISKDELLSVGYTEQKANAMLEAIYFANRDTNKWFSYDKSQNGTIDNVEDEMWRVHNTDDNHKIGDLTPEQFAKKYNLSLVADDKGSSFEAWCQDWIENEDPMIGIKAMMQDRYGVELNQDETQLLYDTMKTQANRWLLKEPALYNRLNNSAYTRLATSDELVSCCGGDISKPPIGEQPKLKPDGTLADAKSCSFVFSSLKDENSVNTSEEVKNRLAWAAFKTIPETQVAKMSKVEYAQYKADWEKVRGMKVSDFRALLKPENKAQLEKFEATSNMTVKQIVDYIDIMEQSTGKSFDSEDWSVNTDVFHNKVMQKLNGTDGDDALLNGKTRADVLPDKKEWLDYLESHGMLLEQFK